MSSMFSQMCVYTKNRDSIPNLARVVFHDTNGEWKDLADQLGELTEQKEYVERENRDS